jgi:hypothetical protein
MRAFERTQVRSNADNCLGQLQAACERGVLRAIIGCTMGCCVRPCCVGAAACNRDAARVRGCSVRAIMVVLAAWMRSNAPSAVERTMAGSSL